MCRSKLLQSLKLLCITLLVTVSACKTQSSSPEDPYEPYNRKMFAVYKGVDGAIVKPVARLYNTIIPKPLNNMVSNFFNNIGEINAVANDLLQARINQAGKDTWRFLFNTTFGVLGLFDVAQHFGLEHHDQDFGLTLAKWGVKKSPYIVLPILGPSTVRDSLSIPVDYVMSVWPYLKPARTRYNLLLLKLIDMRVGFLQSEKIAEAAAIDEYIFLRNAYLQARQHQINKVLGIVSADDETDDTFEPPVLGDDEELAETVADDKKDSEDSNASKDPSNNELESNLFFDDSFDQSFNLDLVDYVPDGTNPPYYSY